jgi:hypothetical protein
MLVLERVPKVPDKVRKREAVNGEHAAKICATCGRTMEWRKSWAKNWENVKFCGDKCRTGKPGDRETALERAILRLLAERGAGKTICPSEAARAVASSDDRASWEPLMEPARAAARRLVAEGRLFITQGGEVVDPSTARGAIRLRLR